MKKSFLVAAAATMLLSGCGGTMGGLMQKAKDNPVLAVAAGIGAGALIVGTGGLALAGPAVAGAGVYGVYQYEDGLKDEVENLSCADAKELARRNYMGPQQKSELLAKACAPKTKPAKK